MPEHRASKKRPASPRALSLSAAEADCLAALRRGLATKTALALKLKRDLRQTASALEALNRAGLISRAGGFRWRPTRRGASCTIRIVAEPVRRRGPKPSGGIVAGSAAERLLETLDRPMRGADLAERLGVTRQRVHQLVVRLHGQGRLRLGDQNRVLHIVARSDDSSLLLGRDEERVLSAFPDELATTATKLAARVRLPAGRRTAALARLLDWELIEPGGSSRSDAAYRLSREGRRHFQRRASERPAEPVALKVKSDRVRMVLTYIAEQGSARIRDVRNATGIPALSMNALMQYLKRRGLARKLATDLNAPYELTPEGASELAEMMRRSRR